MSSDWEKVSLAQLVDIKHGFAFRGEFFSEAETRFQLTTPGNFAIGGGFQTGKGKFYSGPIPEEYVLKAGDLLVTMTDLSKAADTLGYSAVVPDTTGTTWLHNQRVGLVTVKPEAKTTLSFLHYLLRSPEYRHWVVSTATGSTVKHTSPSRIGAYEFLIPPLSYQYEIAKTLGSLDDRITLLRETNQTLEAIAQAIFKSWFVDFDPVRAKMEGRQPVGMDEETAALFPDELVESELGLIPKGWEYAPVESFAEKVGMGPFGSNIKVETFVGEGVPVISGQHLWHMLVEDLKFNFITEDHAQKLNNSCVRHGDVIFTHAGSIGQVSLLDRNSKYKKYVLSQRQFYLRCDRTKMRPEWVVYYFRSSKGQHQLLSYSSQVGVPSLSRPVSNLRSMKVPLPTIALADKFADYVIPIHSMVQKNRGHIEVLSAARDTLLPRLISGKLRVPVEETHAVTNEE